MLRLVLQVRAVGDSPPCLSLRFPAKPGFGAVLRGRLREWLEDVGAAEDEIFDFQLASCEAVALAIGRDTRPVSLVVDVEGSIDGDVVCVRIRDYGLARPPRDLTDGLGIWLVRGMMQRVRIEAHADGYEIELRRSLACEREAPRAERARAAGSDRADGRRPAWAAAQPLSSALTSRTGSACSSGPGAPS